MVMNALLATAVGIELGVSPAETAKGFDDFKPADGRLSIETINNMTVINDAYNSNPAAVRESLKILRSQPGTKVAILGDMNELGHVAEERHREIGAFVAEMGIDLLITVGPLSRFTHEGYYAATGAAPEGRRYFPTVDEFLSECSELLRPDDVVLVKASRGMAFERIVEHLRRL